MSYTKAKVSLQKARDIEQSSASVMLAAKRALAAETSKIEEDRRLTPEGKYEAKQEAKKRHAIEFLQKSHTMRQEYVANVKKAIREAEKVIYTPPRKPDATKLGRFEDAFKTLKTELMFATSQRSAYDKLRAFTDKVDDPYLANRVREDFAELTTKILAIPGDGNFVKGVGAASVTTSARTELGGLYEGLLKPFESDDLKGARDVLETAQMLAEAPRVHRSVAVNDAARDSFGAEYARHINDTDAFFAENPEHAPAPFVDTESERVVQTSEDLTWIYKEEA
ncbi:hypothetical protein [Paenibacillus graminis]|uniref:hypothetical protein n=1 Tax=Paenibacillus graminis TaxID=189425 RepID=UPI002DBB9432|nr:hypothetical protein [Paenibacillus graminis]MEC0167481.1 hypothetical protein [Paenibacillus graminis]